MPIPRYRALQDSLKTQILSGEYPEGALLPSENSLGRVHGLNRMTVRRALEGLVREGFISKRKGRESRVNRRFPSLGLLSFRGFSDVVGSANLTVRTRFLTRPEARAWPVPFLYPLDEAESAAGCVFLQRLRFAGGEPVMLENTYVPDFGMSGLRRRPFVQGSLFRTLAERHGIEVTALDQELRAVPADAFTADHLRIRRGAAVLHIRRRYRTSRDGFNLYGSLFCHTGKYAIGNGFAS